MDTDEKTQAEDDLIDISSSEPKNTEAYDKNLDFIFVVRLLKQDFCRVEYPFKNDKFTNILEESFKDGSKNQNNSQRILFINSDVLVVAQNNQIKIARTSDFFEDGEDAQTVIA